MFKSFKTRKLDRYYKISSIEALIIKYWYLIDKVFYNFISYISLTKWILYSEIFIDCNEITWWTRYIAIFSTVGIVQCNL